MGRRRVITSYVATACVDHCVRGPTGDPLGIGRRKEGMKLDVRRIVYKMPQGPKDDRRWIVDRWVTKVRRGVKMADESPNRSDDEYGKLIRSIAERRDRNAFACLFDHFAPRIRGMILRTGASVEQAEDIAQEAMLTLWRKAGYFDPLRATPAAWVFAIARNLRIDGIRRERRAQVHALLDRVEPEAPEQPDNLVDIDERQRRVAEALQHLPPEQAEVVRMSFIEGKAHGEISKCLELPLGTVKSRLRLAMVRLRQALADLAEEETP